LPKDQFPRLLNNCIENLSPKLSKNIASAFRASGIFPFDAQQVLKRLPGGNSQEDDQDPSDVSAAFTGYLKSLREKEENSSFPRSKRS